LGGSSSVSSLQLLRMSMKVGANSNAGGIAGSNSGYIFNANVEGKLRAPRGQLGVYGGAVGTNVGTVAYVSSNVTIGIGPHASGLMYAGGLAGANFGSLEYSYSKGSVSVVSPSQSAIVAGLVSDNVGNVENCYATGAISTENGGHSVLGGLVAFNFLNIVSSFSTGAISAAGLDNYVGGLVGFDQGEENGGAITNTYWDTTTSGLINLSQGAGNIANDPGITGETTAQLQSKLPKGFNKRTWQENPKKNGGLPYLSTPLR
jgi:hypothetical protein